MADKRTSRRLRWLVLGGIALLVVVAFALSKLRGTPVATRPAERRELVQTVVANGKVLAPAKVQVGSVLLGVVQQVPVEEGQEVKAGQLLIHLRDDEIHAAVEQAKAGVASARIRLAQLRNVRAPAAVEQQKQAEVSLEQAQEGFERIHDLAQRGVATKVQLDDARTALALARSRYQGAALQASSTTSAGVEVRLAATAVAQAQAALDAADARLAQTVIVAPADGTIIKRAVEPGDVVQPGKVLLTLARAGAVKVLVPFDEKNLGLLALGQPATVSAEAFPEQRFKASVEFLAPAVDEQRGTVDVRLLAKDPPGFLRTDMTVSVEVEVARQREALVVPTAAARDTATDSPWVYVLRDGRVARQEIGLGLRGQGFLEVTAGLAPGELVITEDQQRLVPGQRARVQGGGA